MFSSILNYFDLSLLFGGLVAVGSGLVVIMSDSKKLGNKAWGLLSISSAVWSFGYLFMTISKTHQMAFISNWVLHYAAILIPLFYFLFIVGLTDTYQKYRGWLTCFSIVGAYFLVINQTTLFVRDVVPKFIFNFVCDAGPAYLYFTLYFFSIVLFAWYILYRKILTLPSEDSLSLRSVLYSSVAGFIGGGSVFFITFNINFPPYPIALFSFYPVIISYAILRYNLFNIKVISTELFVFTLWIFILFRTLLAGNTGDQITNGVLLLLTVVVGIFLIRSVYNEVEQKEHIQKLAADLANANEKLKELDKKKTEFVSLASHQLRSPLTAIKGYSSMILEGDFGPIADKAKEAVGRVFESSQKLVLVIEDFLNITRIELGRMKYAVTEVDIGQLVQNVIAEIKPNVEKRGLALTYEADQADYKVWADSGKISEVYSNLMDNAIKYTEKGFVKVHLSRIKNEKEGRDYVRFQISDSGVGIGPETLPHLFEKFSRAEDASKTNIIGTGLGLYVAKQIVEAHGGKIWAESSGKGQGSTFFVDLTIEGGKNLMAIMQHEQIAAQSNPSTPPQQTARQTSTATPISKVKA